MKARNTIKHNIIRNKGYSKIEKVIIKDKQKRTYYRQYFNGVPIHDWVEIGKMTSFGITQDQLDILDKVTKELLPEDKNSNKTLYLNNEKPPF